MLEANVQRALLPILAHVRVEDGEPIGAFFLEIGWESHGVYAQVYWDRYGTTLDGAVVGWRGGRSHCRRVRWERGVA